MITTSKKLFNNEYAFLFLNLKHKLSNLTYIFFYSKKLTESVKKTLTFSPNILLINFISPKVNYIETIKTFNSIFKIKTLKKILYTYEIDTNRISLFIHKGAINFFIKTTLIETKTTKLINT